MTLESVMGINHSSNQWLTHCIQNKTVNEDLFLCTQAYRRQTTTVLLQRWPINIRSWF